VPGPLKRFAQSIGLVLTTAAAVAACGYGPFLVPTMLVAGLLLFALLESVLGFYAGCWFGHLRRWGVIPSDVCEQCADVSSRYAGGQPDGRRRPLRGPSTSSGGVAGHRHAQPERSEGHRY
jgi:uncharacterized protein DUF4395